MTLHGIAFLAAAVCLVWCGIAIVWLLVPLSRPWLTRARKMTLLREQILDREKYLNERVDWMSRRAQREYREGTTDLKVRLAKVENRP